MPGQREILPRRTLTADVTSSLVFSAFWTQQFLILALRMEVRPSSDLKLTPEA